ncbi:hypothetical protein GCM10027036_25750 [Flavihumibacter cheonanensis]|jgi:hypothetical protein|uniref:YtxH-like protein n=1 Tax=Flavihumibacter fluminis TaxID=2909236 RepID=A0ABS9BKZ8_9BACT|nr:MULTISPECIES: hypothetical protein [Flavihumibacter]MBU7578380.1 hypothetical protein [Flavihumibacter sp.]MCG7859876.1 hypothetical protein [Flavihumibacter sediminis]MCF1715909.1 hypothetical protein [Flavihumibacter fluminis]MCG7753402.1 hypothetical protein [Flavihumibacter cheonanensis]MCU0385889.1 hypothetical protein [Flavihumibacter sp.]
MKRFQQKAVVMVVMVVGSLIGAFKGQEARQKWMFRILSKQEEKQSRAIRKAEVRKGKVLLDDIEMAAYHNS